MQRKSISRIRATAYAEPKKPSAARELFLGNPEANNHSPQLGLKRAFNKAFSSNHEEISASNKKVHLSSSPEKDVSKPLDINQLKEALDSLYISRSPKRKKASIATFFDPAKMNNGLKTPQSSPEKPRPKRSK